MFQGKVWKAKVAKGPLVFLGKVWKQNPGPVFHVKGKVKKPAIMPPHPRKMSSSIAYLTASIE